MKRRGLLYKLIIINGIILGFILHFLAFALSLWFKGNFFNDKRTLFKNTGSYLAKSVEYYYENKDNFLLSPPKDLSILFFQNIGS